MDLSSSGHWLVAGRGNQLVVYSVAAERELQRLVDPSIHESHPECAHLDIAQAVAVSPDQQTVVSGGYRNLKVWRRAPTALAKPTVVSESLAAYLKPTDAAKLEVVDQDVTPDGKYLIALEKTDDGVKPRLYSLPDRKLIREFEAAVFDSDSLEASTRKVGLRKERLRVAKADVDVAKKRKEDDEKNAKKSAEELKKSEEELPKKEEALA